MNLARNISSRGVALLGNWFGTSRELPFIDVELVLELARVLHKKNRTPYLLETDAVLKTSGTRA